jgi:uracil-DNA glycosylase
MSCKYEYTKIIKRVHPDWLDFFKENKKELETILETVNKDIDANKIIFPLAKDIFRTLFYFGPKETKLVLLGQDPYINSEIHLNQKVPQACGMSFGVPKIHKKIPPSLANIFKEIKNCYPDSIIPSHGFLKRWVRQENILLLNSALTVIESKSNSHQALWGGFTDKLIKYISDNSPHTVFLLMGNFAIGKSKLINSSKHKIFTTIHPSPLSASNGFFGCQVFLKINQYFESEKIKPIKWLKQTK